MSENNSLARIFPEYVLVDIITLFVFLISLINSFAPLTSPREAQ